MDLEDTRTLAELVADVRASLDEAWSRGVRDDTGESLPVADAQVLHAPVESSAFKGWSALAQAARAAPVDAATTLKQVRNELGDCRRCGLYKTRRSIVFGVGDPSADLVVVGLAPGNHEDQSGEPFVGPEGQMLDKMLENVLGLKRSQVYLLNVVKCRSQGDRNPLVDEVEACRPFLEGQLQAIQPKLLLVLGGVAFQALFRTNEGIDRARGQWWDHLGVPTMPTFDPAHLLSEPDDKRKTFADLKAVRTRYDSEGGCR